MGNPIKHQNFLIKSLGMCSLIDVILLAVARDREQIDLD